MDDFVKVTDINNKVPVKDGGIKNLIKSYFLNDLV